MKRSIKGDGWVKNPSGAWAKFDGGLRLAVERQGQQWRYWVYRGPNVKSQGARRTERAAKHAAESQADVIHNAAQIADSIT